MKGDFTRSTFRSERHYSGVRLQQGRVQLDADFNEQVDIEAHRDRTTARDVIGPCGAPDDGGGFQIFPTLRLASIDAAAGVARAVGQRATILASADGGATWTTQAAPTAISGDLDSIDVVDANVAFAAGAGPAVAKTTNGGTSWSNSTLPSAATGSLRAISFFDAQRGCAVGDGGLVLVTTNGGSSWARKTVSGVGEDLFGVSFVSATHAWAVGDAGRIIATTDGGSTWQIQQVAPGFGTALRAVRFVGQATGWAVGDGATILTTGNGGTTWTERAAPAGVTATLRAIDAESAAIVWAVGDGPTVLRSGDGGATWQALPAIGHDLSGVRVSGGTVLACGELGTIARAPAGPSPSWTTASLPTPSPARDLGIGGGRIYVDGLLCEAEQPLRYLAQADLPDAPLPSDPGLYVAYLDVWQRHLTALERAELREVALGGPDTATRTQNVWQVRLQGVAAGTTCAAFGPEWTPAGAPLSSGRLRAHGKPAPAAANECMVPAEGGYRRLENQLYRVEVIDPGAAGAAKFAWSRDNGALAARLVRVDDLGGGKSRLTVSDPGRDRVIGFAAAKFVELSDEGRALRGQPAGRIFEVDSVLENTITIKHTPSGGAALAEFSAGATVRRWDGFETVQANGWRPLEGGVEVQFAPGQYASGDYWTIPARTNSAAVEWPAEDGAPRFEPRHGTRHAYCALALVSRDGVGNWSLVSDCRPLFTPLTGQTRMTMAGGDGQELEPGTPQGLLPYPLEVAVMNGRRAVAGATVRFAVEEGGGSLAAPGQAPGTPPASRDAQTDARGIAACDWRLDTSESRHRVVARLLDRAGDPLDAPLHFNARLAAAGGGGVCTVEARPGDDLAAALERLRDAGGGELCLAAGEYDLEAPLQLEGLRRVVIEGRGPATVLRAKVVPVLDAIRCEELWIRSLRIEGGAKPVDEERAIGALNLRGCRNARLLDCEVAVPDGEAGQVACVAIEEAIADEASTVIERNRLEVGVGRFGVVITESGSVRVVGNRITLTGDPQNLVPNLVRGGIRTLGERMALALSRAGTGRTLTVEAEEVNLAFRVADEPELREAFGALAISASSGVLATESGEAAISSFLERLERDLEADERFGSRSLSELAEIEAESPEAAARLEREHALARFARRLRSGDSAIVARGEKVLGELEISRNEIDGCVRGIGVFAPARDEWEGTTRFALDANSIHCQGERELDQRPIAVELRNPGAVSLTGTHAFLRGEWAIDPETARRNKDIHAIRVEGLLGPYMVVRRTSIDGFPVGVVVFPEQELDDLPPEERDWLWLVAETLANRAFDAISAPPSVEQERNRNRFF